MDNQEKQDIRERVLRDISDATLWTKLWSAVHHTFLFGGAVLSAVAAIILQLDMPVPEASTTNLAILIAGAAALTSTIAASGGFERKWRTNRLIKIRLIQLEIDLINPDVENVNLRQDLKDIVQLRYDGIVGAEHPTKESS
jgi:hypothetical protein